MKHDAPKFPVKKLLPLDGNLHVPRRYQLPVRTAGDFEDEIIALGGWEFW
jgi:hypothetical protein